MATLQKIYRVMCKTKIEGKLSSDNDVFEDITDFKNQFPTDLQIEACIKRHKENHEIISWYLRDKYNINYVEITITHFLRYAPSTLDILSQSKSLHNEYVSLSPDAKTISSEEQKLRDEEKRLERDRKEENGEEITEDDF